MNRDNYTKVTLKTRSIKVSDPAWQESQALIIAYNMSREHYMMLANKLIKDYFEGMEGTL